MLVHGAAEGVYPRHIMIEYNNEGGKELCLGSNQAEDIDE